MEGPAGIAGPISQYGVVGMDSFIESIIAILQYIGAFAFISLCYGIGACRAKENYIAGILLLAGGIGLVVSIPLLVLFQYLLTK